MLIFVSHENIPPVESGEREKKAPDWGPGETYPLPTSVSAIDYFNEFSTFSHSIVSRALRDGDGVVEHPMAVNADETGRSYR